ncbi:unnamed protein product [Soboliphyme baturini]|uniref:Na_Ca_ex domain-containing protein n=1 Tax=Soboliphyme baturini TaxID=241478 RepID=A0A183J1Y4_9BILA|nr:unnamed protein product [Soboliphyme baturini]
MHYLSLPWKLLTAACPPTDYWSGWACFVFSILLIGLLTALIGDIANHFGCATGLLDSVTAISFLAVGTSVPDTLASRISAVQDTYADSSISNVTGSNSVNVFLGIGLAWLVAAVYHAVHHTSFYVQPGSLAFSVTIFSVEAFVCIAILLLRRFYKPIGGELGGPLKYKIPSVAIFVSLWCIHPA